MTTATDDAASSRDDVLLSPRSMAQAALAAGMAERERRDRDEAAQQGSAAAATTTAADGSGGGPAGVDETFEGGGGNGNKRPRTGERSADRARCGVESVGGDHAPNTTTALGDEPVAEQQQQQQQQQPERLLESVWEELSSNATDASDASADGTDKDGALQKTEAILVREVEALLRSGIEAFHAHDSVARELRQMTEVAEARGREVHRLQASEAQSRATVSNLLRAVEASKSDARDSSRHAQIEARLRSEITTFRSERDAALAEASESKRRVGLLEEEVRIVKAKLARVAQEKVRMERDSRAAMSLARSLDSHATSDTDFYKRKVAELNDRLQAQQALVAEQKHELGEMRRQMERSISQNRLAQIRAEGSRSGGGRFGRQN